MQDIDPSRVLPDLIRSEGKAMPILHYSGPFYSGLLTDLYELTMAAGYVQNHFGARPPSSFSFVISRSAAVILLPPG